jgi:CubicO group peptidase (beta-lactamase class C family)
MITLLTNQIINKQYRGMLIVKNGALVHEVYFGRYNRDILNPLYSVTKSVTSALIGIAIEEGFIDGLEVTLLSVPPEYADQVDDERKHEITLEHLLTMRSRLEWDEGTYPYTDPKNSHYNLSRATDWMAYVISKPLKDTPGTQLVYNTGAVHPLSAIIKQTTGQHADQFARKHLFGPLDIVSHYWSRDPKGYPSTGGSNGGLSLRARDLAKFGYLFLNRGRWNGK